MAESLLEYLDVPSVHVLAHDIGDTVAQELMARHISRQTEGGLTGKSCKTQSSACYVFKICMLQNRKHAQQHCHTAAVMHALHK